MSTDPVNTQLLQLVTQQQSQIAAMQQQLQRTHEEVTRANTQVSEMSWMVSVLMQHHQTQVAEQEKRAKEQQQQQERATAEAASAASRPPPPPPVAGAGATSLPGSLERVTSRTNDLARQTRTLEGRLAQLSGQLEGAAQRNVNAAPQPFGVAVESTRAFQAERDVRAEELRAVMSAQQDEEAEALAYERMLAERSRRAERPTVREDAAYRIANAWRSTRK